MACCSDEIIGWVMNRRWYPLKGVPPDEVITINLGVNLRGFLVKIGTQQVFAPVMVREGEYVEAEYTAEYIENLVSGKSLLEVKKYCEFPEGRLVVKPLSTAWTNVISVIEVGSSKYVLKGYRTFSPELSEPRFLRYLTRKKFPYSPELVLEVSLGSVVVAVMTKYIESLGDGGMPFYLSALKYFGSGEYDDIEVKARKLGYVVASFHKTMNLCDERWCSPKEVTDEVINVWLGDLKQQEIRAKESMKRLAEKLKMNVTHLIDDSLSKLEKSLRGLRGLRLIRTHGDLHLAQTLYDGKDFILIDFEGEPGRTEERRSLLETASRDLACLLRSLHYITMFAYAETSKKKLEEVFLDFLREDDLRMKALWWQDRVFSALLEEYLKSVSLRDIQGFDDKELFIKSLKAWVLERSLYEFFYEINYGTGYVYVPLEYLLGENN
ncbi:MAG: hypothetical protein QN229_06405 [Desulfurococcaceae archaeon TW002]